MTPKTLPKTAIEKQINNEVHLVLFDILFWDGESVCDEAYADRRKYIAGALRDTGGEIHLPQTTSLAHYADFTQEFKLLALRGWEGYILRDILTPTAYSLNGKEQRPIGCWKVKTTSEDEFVATGYELGNGKNKDRVGKLKIIQYANNHKNSIIDCGSVGGGFTDEQRLEALKWEYPCVIRVEFDRRQQASDGTCKLRFPVFVCKHPDKEPKDCHE